VRAILNEATKGDMEEAKKQKKGISGERVNKRPPKGNPSEVKKHYNRTY